MVLRAYTDLARWWPLFSLVADYVSRVINPECTHLAGDMRDLRVGRDFDAVFVHDAIDHMTTGADLRAAFTTAAAHLREGGLLVVAPDHVAETYAAGIDCGGSDDEDGRGLRYPEWTYDPDSTTGTRIGVRRRL